MTLAVTALLTGCASSGGSTPSVANPYSSSGGSSLGEVKVNTMRVFGDSYSDPRFHELHRHHQLGHADAGRAARSRNPTSTRSGGARASYGEARAFDKQINNWQGRGSAISDGDLTVVYLGHNDMGRNGSPGQQPDQRQKRLLRRRGINA